MPAASLNSHFFSVIGDMKIIIPGCEGGEICKPLIVNCLKNDY